MKEQENNNGNKEVVFFIQKKQHKTEKADLSIRELLKEFAKVNPQQYNLALKHGNEIKEYSNLDEVISLENGMHFVLFDNAPTPVS